MIKVAAYLVAFYLVYALLLSNDTSYARNRAFILISLTAAMVFPMFTIITPKPLDIQKFGNLLSEVFISANGVAHKNVSPEVNLLPEAKILRIIYTIYIIVTAAFILKIITDLLNLVFMIVRHRENDSRIIRFSGYSTSGFSAMGYIFISDRLSPEESAEIVRHEQNHLRENHFLDIIFLEIIKAFQWFNPVIYMYNNSLRALHEYQADQICLSSGISLVKYQNLLLGQIFRSKAFNLSNSFSNPSLVRKRMLMMTKKRTASIAGIKMLLAIPVVSVVFLAISAYREAPANTVNDLITKAEKANQVKYKLTDVLPLPPKAESLTRSAGENTAREGNYKNEQFNTATAKDEPFVIVDEMPMFPGGDKELLKYIAGNTSYPESAKLNNVQGKVIVRFSVSASGKVERAAVLQGVSPELNEEALRVVNTLPDFIPGRQGGVPVPVWYVVPITFTLK